MARDHLFTLGAPVDTNTRGRLAVPVDTHDHVRGPIRAPVTLVEFGHYQCAECADLEPHLRDLLRLRAPGLRLVFRHFPLPVTHLQPYKLMASEIAEAAAVRHRFWPMHDWLFAHQHEIDRAGLRRAVLLLDLPPEAVDVEVSQRVYRTRIVRDYEGGLRSGVLHTPTLFVNGGRVDSGTSLPDLLPALDRALGASD